jgi:predicted nucleotidyltransferase
MNFNLLEKSILATITYYDAMDYPLTGFEIFKYLINPSHIVAVSDIKQDTEIEPVKEIKFVEILKILNDNNFRNKIEEKNGFYYLKGRKENYQIRNERQKISDEMWKKTKKTIKWLQMIPYIKMVLVNGSMAMYNAKKESDIDLMIVTKNKRIWTTRFLTTLFFQIIGKRRHGEKIKNRFCLNHYITNDFLKSNLLNLYVAHLYAHLVPVLEIEEGIYNRFQFENRWIGNYLCFYNIDKLDNQKKIKNNSVMKFTRNCQEIILNTFLGNILEIVLGFFQKRHIKNHPLINQKEGRIIFDDNQLEFHPNSRGIKILEKYEENILTLDIGIKKEHTYNINNN